MISKAANIQANEVGCAGRPRIMFVNHSAALGGGELSLLDISEAYRTSSCVVLLEDGPFRERLEERRVRVKVLPASSRVRAVTRSGGFLQTVSSMPGAARLVRQLAGEASFYDLIYSNSQKAMAVAGPAGWVTGLPVVWHLRDLLTGDHFSPLRRRGAAAWANRFADRVIANSQATLAAFVSSGGRAAAASLVYNGIDVQPFDEPISASVLRREREALGLGPDRVVGSFSRLAPWKGQHVLLEALAGLPGVQGLFVGGAMFEEDAPYGAELQRLAAQWGVADRVHFVGFRDDIPRLLRLVDVVAHTSVAPEPFGRVIVEGMLSEKAVVATRAGGATEIIEDGRTGLLVAPGDAAELRGALRRLLDHPEENRRLALAGAAAARSRFSIATMLEDIDTHLLDLLANAPELVASRGASGV